MTDHHVGAAVEQKKLFEFLEGVAGFEDLVPNYATSKKWANIFWNVFCTIMNRDPTQPLPQIFVDDIDRPELGPPSFGDEPGEVLPHEHICYLAAAFLREKAPDMTTLKNRCRYIIEAKRARGKLMLLVFKRLAAAQSA